MKAKVIIFQVFGCKLHLALKGFQMKCTLSNISGSYNGTQGQGNKMYQENPITFLGDQGNQGYCLCINIWENIENWSI